MSGSTGFLVSDAWFGWVTVNAVLWMLLFLHLFLLRIHRHPAPWLTRLMVGHTALAALVTLPLPGNPIDATLVAPVLYPTMLVTAAIACSHGLYWSWRARSLEGTTLAAYGLAALLLGVHDWLLQNNLIDIEHLSLSNYAQIATIFAFCHFALRRYTDAMRGCAMPIACLRNGCASARPSCWRATSGCARSSAAS